MMTGVNGKAHRYCCLLWISRLLLKYSIAILTKHNLFSIIFTIELTDIATAYFIGLVHFERHSQNTVGNIGILVLWQVCEKHSCRDRCQSLQDTMLENVLKAIIQMS